MRQVISLIQLCKFYTYENYNKFHSYESFKFLKNKNTLPNIRYLRKKYPHFTNTQINNLHYKIIQENNTKSLMTEVKIKHLEDEV